MAMALRSSALLCCVLASLTAHALLMAADWRGSPRGEVQARRKPVLLLHAQAQAKQALVAAPVLAAPTAARPAPAAAPDAAPPGPAPEPVPTPAAPPAAPAVAMADTEVPAPELESLPLASAEAAWDEGAYIPRPQLSQPPVLQHAVALVWPEDGPSSGHYRDIIALYIDEQGVVQRVRIDGAGLPPALQDQARQAFLGARFLPGQLQGQDVKSLIRIEVEFDAQALARSRGALR